MKNYELQVQGRNELKNVAKQEIENLLPQLAAFLGKRIDTQNGLSKKFAVNKINPKPVALSGGFAQLHLNYLTVSYGKLELRMSICLNGGKYEDHTYYCQYFERSYDLGKVENFVLIELFSLDQIVKDNELDKPIILEDELNKIKRLVLLENELHDLKFSIKIPV
jgi:hypothetical protein